jgi:hypothetical protein
VFTDQEAEGKKQESLSIRIAACCKKGVVEEPVRQFQIYQQEQEEEEVVLVVL